MSLSIKLLGSLELSYQNKVLDLNIDRKSLALIVYLALNNTAILRDDLAELLWGPGKLNNLRQALYKLRQLPGAETWLNDGDKISLNAQTDFSEFEKKIKQENYAKALELWQGSFLEGFKAIKAPDFMNWLELERSRINSLQQEASDALLEQLESSADYQKALPLAKELLERDPLNETAHRTIMRLEHTKGNTEAALEQFEKLRIKLKEELGVEPLNETLELLADIEQGGAASHKNARIIQSQESVPNLATHFIGRERLLKQAHEILAKHKQVLIHGFGGIGKTALAAQLSQTYLSKGKLLWLELGQSDPASSLDALAQAFDVQKQLAQSQDKNGFLQSLLKEQNIGLIVLDDVWNAYTLSVLVETFNHKIPLIVTSRQRYPRLKRVNVGRLERSESLELLNYSAEQSLEDANALCAHLGDHAYALKVAGLNLKQNKQSPNQLLASIKNAPHDLRIPQALTSEEQGSIANLLKVSLEPLDDRAYEAFLAYGGLFSSSATPELIAKLLERDTETIEDALFTLSQHGLAERSSNAGSDIVAYRLHDLAHSYTKAINNHRSKSVIQAAKNYLEKHKDDPDSLDAEIQNILGASEQASNEMLVEFMALLVLEGNYYIGKGHSPKSIQLLKKAIHATEKLSVTEITHELLAKLGNYYLNYLGQHEEALDYYEKALRLAVKANNLSRQAAYYSLIGVIYLRRKDKHAKLYFEKALELCKSQKESLDMCIVFNNNGYFHAIEGRFRESIGFYQKVIEVSAQLAKITKYEASELKQRQFLALFNMSQGLHELKHYSEALVKREEALQFAEENNNQLWIADALYGLGETQHMLGKREAAGVNLINALNIYQAHQAKAYSGEIISFMKTHNYPLESI